MVKLPRVLIAAPASGHGKTTVTTGLMAALRGDGSVVSPHKVGPDYIDPGFHAIATGRPGRNVDPWLCSEELIVPLLLHGAGFGRDGTPADIAVIEGVMGLFDGRLGTDGFASASHIARLTRTPVVLVIDTSHASRSLGALVKGMATYDPQVSVAGVILNKVASPTHEREIRRSIEPLGIPVLGAIRRDAQIEHPERHLGLVPAEESSASEALVAALAERIGSSVDLAEVRRIAASAPQLEAVAWEPGDIVSAPSSPGDRRPVVAVAGGRAFTFRYRETLELMAAAGLEPVEFDPTSDATLPEGTRGLYLGGGFPEVHATELAANESLNAAVREAIASGMPTVAECAGLLYLGRSVDETPMTGALGHTAAMHKRLAMGYRSAVAPTDTLLARAGETVTGHEFHRTRVSGIDGEPAWSWTSAAGETVVDGVSADPAGTGAPTVHASYLHLSWAGHPHLAQRFADAVHAFTPAPTPLPTSLLKVTDLAVEPPTSLLKTVDLAVETPFAEADLDHHGDRDVIPDGLDFAVNVHPDGPPSFLRHALDAVDVTRYPDVHPARVALATHHQLDVAQVLPTAGAAEAFTLLARAWSSRRWCMVHPQFTEPESALLSAGATVHRHVLTDPFVLDVDSLIADARDHACGVVMIGNPTNPTGVLHPLAAVDRMIAAGLDVVVDEAFLDAAEDLSALNLLRSDREVDHLQQRSGRFNSEVDRSQQRSGDGSRGQVVVVKSLTKIWGVPGIRAGWLAADAQTIAQIEPLQQPWSVSAHAIAAMIATSTPEADAEAAARTAAIPPLREDLIARLTAIGLPPVAHPSTPFVLVDTHLAESPRQKLAAASISVRRGETFPGLGPSWIRLAVRIPEHHERLCTALAALVQKEGPR